MKNNQITPPQTTSVEKYQEIIESISDGIVGLDNDWCYTFINDKAAHLLSLESSGPLLGKNIWKSFNGIIGEELKNACKKALSQKEYVYLEQYFSKYDVWVENHIYPSATGITINFRNVTDRKKREHEAQKLAQRNTLIMNSMRENFMLSDENLNIVDVNPSLCKAIGYSREELLKMKVSDFYHDLSFEEVKHNFQESLLSGQLLVDTKIQKKNGEIADVEVTHAEMVIDGRKYTASFGRDISAFKKAEAAIKKSNHRFELIGDITQDAVWEIDLTNNKRWANEIHQCMYGLQKGDPVPNSKEWESRIHADNRKIIRRSLDDAIRKGKSKWLGEYWFNTANKGWVYIYDRTYIVRNAEGHPISMLGSMLDITQLKETEKQVITEKKLSDSIINTLPGIFYLYDEKGEFIRWNKNFETISKYNAEEIAKMHPLDFYSHDEKPLLRKKIATVFEKGYASVEANFLTKEKKKIPFYFTGIMTYLEGKKCLLGTGMDITEIRNAEKALDEMKQQILNQKVQEQKKISRAIISTQEKERDHIGRELHDNVNQILAGARLYLSMAGKQNEDIREVVKYPMELLDSSIQEIRLLTHKHATPPKDILLKELVKTILDQLSKTTGMSTSLVYDVSQHLIDDDLKINIYRIIQEQINNISRHSAASSAQISIEADSETILLEIRDDGKGFNLNRQRDGIGISNIMNRVDSFNGVMKIKTAPGKGCVMNIQIPYQCIDSNIKL